MYKNDFCIIESTCVNSFSQRPKSDLVVFEMHSLICLFALVALAAGANVICTDYGKDLGGGSLSYYEIPIPRSCTSNGYRPDYRIKGSGEYFPRICS